MRGLRFVPAWFNPMTIVSHQKTLHTLFLISVWIKGVAGVLETAAGIFCFFITPAALASFVVALTAPELSEDPDDWIATTLVHAVRRFSADTALFAAAYLIIHGLVKLFLVAGLLLGRLWAYPLSLWFLAAFIIYQGYRYTHTHSILLVLLTVVDLAVAYLIWREYQSRKQIHLQPAPDAP
jgi:uncharacterized membrane protein